MEDQVTLESIERPWPVTDPEIDLAVAQPFESDEPATNPDAWLQWALIIGLLGLMLVCALLILIAWTNR